VQTDGGPVPIVDDYIEVLTPSGETLRKIPVSKLLGDQGEIVWEFYNPGWQGEKRAGMYRVVRLPEVPSWLGEHTRGNVGR